MDLTKLKSKTTLEKVRNYEGKNEHILKMKKKLENEGFFLMTPSQISYVEENYNVSPIELNKIVEITTYLGEQLKEKFNLKNTPEKVFIETVLGEGEKSYHVKGKLYKNQKENILYHIPKTQLLTDLFFEPYEDLEVNFDSVNKINKKNRNLFPHQETAIKFLLKRDKSILSDDMGLGKSMSSICAALLSGAEKILVICPANAKINWFREITDFIDEEMVTIVKSGYWQPKVFTIINYDILNRFHEIQDKRKKEEAKSYFNDEKFDLMIVDECFTYDTIVDTEIGKIPIGKIIENQMDIKILSYNLLTNQLEYNKINRWIEKKTKNSLLRIKTHNNVFIDCTPNHKIYVKNKGYVKAEEIKQGDELYYLSNTTNERSDLEKTEILFKKMLWPRFRFKKKDRAYKEKNPHTKKKSGKLRILWDKIRNQSMFETKILFNQLFGEVEDGTTGNKKKNLYKRSFRKNKEEINRSPQKKPTNSKQLISKNEDEQSYDKPNYFGKSETKTNRENLFKSWWKWESNETARKNLQFIRRATKWLGIGVPNKNIRSKRQISIIAKLVLTGHWKSIFKNSYRNRRKFSQNQEMEIFGSEKNGSINYVRVESITILESGSGLGREFNNPKNTTVYNLEIENNHNYFANNILVSNCHMIKNKDTIRGKIVAQIAENIPKVWLLTGTPIANRPMDYYNLLKVCQVPVTDNFQHFAYRYCAAKSFNKRLQSGKIKKIWLTDGASNLEELHQKTKNYVLRRKKEDHLDLPPKIVSPFYLELENKKGYETAFEDYVKWLELEGKNLGPARQMVEMVVLRKFISQEKVSYTIDMVQNFLEQSETRKVIIFTVFTESLKKLKEEFGEIAVCHNGEMSDKEKQKSIDRFQTDPNVRVFIGNIISAGSAITLTASDTTLFHDIDFVPSNHQQAEDRNFRIGQDKTVNVYYPIFAGTIEERIYEILQKKKEVISKVMGENVGNIDIAEDFISTLFKI